MNLTDPVPLTDTSPPEEVLSTSAHALLRAIMAISTDLDLASVLLRLVEAAAELTGARYGALGVVPGPGTAPELITTGTRPDGDERIGHPPNGLGVPIRIRGTVFGNLYLTQKSNGRSFSRQDEALVQTLANAAALVIENARAYGLSERRRQWLEAAAELAGALQPPLALDEALQAIAERSRAAANAIAAAVVQFAPGHHPVISAQDNPEDIDLTETVRGVLDEAHAADQQAVTLEVDLHDRHALVLPLRAHLADPGVLLLVFDAPLGSSVPEEREFLGGFADQAGLAVDRAQAFADREELLLVTERARIARDLHDVVIQRLFAAGLRLEGLRRSPGPTDADTVIGGVVTDLDLTILDIRTTIFGLENVLAQSAHSRW